MKRGFWGTWSGFFETDGQLERVVCGPVKILLGVLGVPSFVGDVKKLVFSDWWSFVKDLWVESGF